MVLKEENGSDSIAVPLVDEKHWDELVILIAVVFYIYSLSDNCNLSVASIHLCCFR